MKILSNDQSGSLACGSLGPTTMETCRSGSAKRFMALCLVATAVSFTGCMTTPGDGQFIGSINNPVTFSGFLMYDPDEQVYIYARANSNDTWKLIGVTATDDFPYQYQGHPWYYFDEDFQIPTWIWQKTRSGFSCQIRAENTHADLALFQAGWADYFGDYSTIEKMYKAKGAGTVITIYGS